MQIISLVKKPAQKKVYKTGNLLCFYCSYLSWPSPCIYRMQPCNTVDKSLLTDYSDHTALNPTRNSSSYNLGHQYISQNTLKISLWSWSCSFYRTKRSHFEIFHLDMNHCRHLLEAVTCNTRVKRGDFSCSPAFER